MPTRRFAPLHPNSKDITGANIERWNVLGYLGGSMWLCRCSCGTEKRIHTANIRRSRSCGCLRDELASARSRTHGLSKSAEYKVWAGIKRRCLNRNDPSYPDYGGSGVTVCQRWADSFEAFLEDMGCRPTPRHTIDRIKNSKGYEPGNCRWATRAEQNRNKKNNRLITFRGVTLVSAQWARRTGIDRATIEYRLDNGWSVERALTTPAVHGRNQFSTD